MPAILTLSGHGPRLLRALKYGILMAVEFAAPFRACLTLSARTGRIMTLPNARTAILPLPPGQPRLAFLLYSYMELTDGNE
jgi:hypothetical protein